MPIGNKIKHSCHRLPGSFTVERQNKHDNASSFQSSYTFYKVIVYVYSLPQSAFICITIFDEKQTLLTIPTNQFDSYASKRTKRRPQILFAKFGICFLTFSPLTSNHKTKFG
jgi:hypothetical protein